MKKQFADYTWLAGSHGRRGSLWQGPDHLLVVEGRGVVLALTELYRRIDYRNIQILTITPTRSHVWLSVLSGLAALLFGWFTSLAWDSEIFLPISLGLPAGLLAVIGIVQFARGPTCICTLQTSVQELRLKPLNRLATARPVMLHLESLCREHQRELTAAPSATPSGHPLAASAPPPPLVPRHGAKSPWNHGGPIRFAGLLAVVWGLLLAGELFVSSPLYTMLNVLAGVASTILAIVALVRTTQYLLPSPLPGVLWTALGIHLLSALALYVLALVSTQALLFDESPQAFIERTQRTAEDFFGTLPAFRFDQTRGWGWGVVTLGGVLVVCGVVQLIYSLRRHTPSAEPPPLSA